jgi:DNA-binding LytR/AlgR family response regulator
LSIVACFRTGVVKNKIEFIIVQNAIVKPTDFIQVILIEKDIANLSMLKNFLQNAHLNTQVSHAFNSIHNVEEWMVLSSEVIIADKNEDIDELNKIINTDIPVILTGVVNEKQVLETKAGCEKLNIVGFIKKPFVKQEIEDEIKKFSRSRNYFFSKINNAANAPQENDNKKKQFYVVRNGKKHTLIKIADIAYFFTEKNLTYVVETKGSKMPVGASLTTIQKLLNAERFYRISRKYFVSINSVTKFREFTRNRIQVLLTPQPAEIVLVSASASKNFIKWLKLETGE